MNKEELIGKLQMVYVGDKNALNELIGYYDGLKEVVELLKKENQKYKEVIDKVSSQIKLYGKYDGEKCTRCFSMMTADFNKLLDILKVGGINE